MKISTHLTIPVRSHLHCALTTNTKYTPYPRNTPLISRLHLPTPQVRGQNFVNVRLACRDCCHARTIPSSFSPAVVVGSPAFDNNKLLGHALCAGHCGQPTVWGEGSAVHDECSGPFRIGQGKGHWFIETDATGGLVGSGQPSASNAVMSVLCHHRCSPALSRQ